MNSKYHFKFEELTMYQKALDFADLVNVQISQFPKEETYRLASQFIRAADSIALNIAEGSSSTKPNFNRYLQMAWDSAQEYIVCSTKAKRRDLLMNSPMKKIENLLLNYQK